MAPSTSSTLAVSIPDAAKMVGFSRAKIYREINAGRLPVRKAGHRTLIRVSDLQAYIDALPAGGPVAA